MKKTLLRDAVAFFFLLGILFIPYPFYLLKAQLPVTDFLFGKLIGFIAKNIFGHPLSDTRVYSDFTSMYILVLLLGITAFILSLVISYWKKWPLNRERSLPVLYSIFYYYLSLQLLKYGADKIFKNQFYVPEPNILYTPLGRVNKDLLYWSSMGTSHFYSVFLGALEILAGLLVVVKRTRLAGFLLSFGILLNVVVINFAFDISVKLFSLFLLGLTIYLAAPYCRRMLQSLLSNRVVEAVKESEPLISNRFFSVFIKCFAAGLICLEVFYPAIKTGRINGDTASRPFLHGAYQVVKPVSGIDTSSAESDIKMFFIHKDGYIIFQDRSDQMADYKLQYDTAGKLLVLTDYQMHQRRVLYDYFPADSLLTLYFNKPAGEYTLTGKAIDWRRLPALSKEFHWTVD